MVRHRRYFDARYRDAQRALGWLGFIGWILMAMGCPSEKPPQEQTSPDAGVTDQTTPLTECPKGATCLFLTKGDARSCAVLMTRSGEAHIKVDFSGDVIGQTRPDGKRLGLAFVWQKHEAISATQPLVAIAPESGEETWKLNQATCYDAKGKPLKDAEIQVKVGDK